MMYQIARLSFSILPILLGIVVIANTLLDAAASLQAKQWPTTQGSIIDYDGGGIFNYSGANGAKLAYQYMVDGKNYTSQRAAFGIGGASDVKSDRDQQLTVHYSPINHSEATLLVGLRPAYLLQTLIGIALIFVGKSLWFRLK